ncbi:hypothetical protein MNY66_16380 (plasmid) [Moellerella wisconsensis]|uniref:Uncharacterized protein n=1 Tax=Moellerella wisconsensis TaxID=158849 RepID=A0ACD3YDX7_9GAMM|nr:MULTISPECIES: hypothetical protein [Morganellaceae]QCJ72365.1 hypothetical protein C9446_20585 [Providencia heimbachae]UNH40619.1 hypothetical protein MNY70_17430 [Moellerella wisconsensis]UNH44323.1 hypothetical protein MNY66_16380 [Moellerella wisconsensis]
MQITKTSHNFAKRRGLALTTERIDGADLLCIWEENNDSEWLCSYDVHTTRLTYRGNVYLSLECVNALPKIIIDENQLRAVITLIANTLKTTA